MNSHDGVGVNIGRDRGEHALRRALTDLSGHMDIHFRAHMLSSREAYNEKLSDLGGEGRVHAEGESYFPTHHEIPGKMSHVWLGSPCTSSSSNAVIYKKYNIACVSSYSQTDAPAGKRPALA